MKFSFFLTGFLLSGCVLALSACSVSSDTKEGGDSLKATTFATYELIEGCSTGVKKVTGANEAEVDAALCESLKTNESNGGCAQYQREQAFKAYKCAGNWPHPPVSGFSASSAYQYSYSSNTCSSGKHYVASSNSDLGKKAFCKLLLNDELNANCARVEREERYLNDGCKAE